MTFVHPRPFHTSATGLIVLFWRKPTLMSPLNVSPTATQLAAVRQDTLYRSPAPAPLEPAVIVQLAFHLVPFQMSANPSLSAPPLPAS